MTLQSAASLAARVGAEAHLGWRHALPAWVWLGIGTAALAVGFAAYARLEGPRLARAALAVLRALLLLSVAVLAAGPKWVRPVEQIEPDTLLVLVDRSRSLTIRDMGGVEGARRTREEALRAALRAHGNAFETARGQEKRRVRWFGFADRLRGIEPRQLGEADGDRTRIAGTLRRALRRVPEGPVGGVVLLTDGRRTGRSERPASRLLRQEAVPVFPVPLGAADGPVDWAVGRVDAPESAFVEDTVPVRLWVDRYPEGETKRGAVEARLVNAETGRVMDRRSLDRDRPGTDPVRLQGEGQQPGEARWRVELRYDGERPELVERNNERAFEIELVDRALRVLYLDGYPRWEYRYLKNMLLRQEDVRAGVLLNRSPWGLAAEGDPELAALPDNPEALQPYDVIMLGDGGPGALGTERMKRIRAHVAREGAGLIFLGGARAMPGAYADTPLADLLPMREPGQVGRATAGPFAARATAEARRLGVMRLAEGETGIPDRLPVLRWVQAAGALKPAASPLAEAHAASGNARPQPLVMRMPFGAGQSVYVATDETWRWRYQRGPVVFERFWGQLLRMLARQRARGGGKRAWLAVSRRRVELGDPVVVRLRVRDPALRDLEMNRVELTVGRADAEDPDAGTRLQLRPTDDGSEHVAGRTYRTVWRPSASGALRVRATEPALADLGLEEQITVIHPADELRHPMPDHARLARLAERTGGEVVPLEELDTLPARVPNRARRTAKDVAEPLWPTLWALLVPLALVTLEWVGRKWIRLL